MTRYPPVPIPASYTTRGRVNEAAISEAADLSPYHISHCDDDQAFIKFFPDLVPGRSISWRLTAANTYEVSLPENVSSGEILEVFNLLCKDQIPVT